MPRDRATARPPPFVLRIVRIEIGRDQEMIVVTHGIDKSLDSDRAHPGENTPDPTGSSTC